MLHPHVSASVADFKEHGLKFAVHEHSVVNSLVGSLATQELPKLISLLTFIEFQLFLAVIVVEDLLAQSDFFL